MEKSEVKYRAWDKENNCMIYPLFKEKGIGELRVGELIDRYEIRMQYTGLKDKDGKGKEIYHKDIFGSRNGNVTVEWIDDGWFVCWDDDGLQRLNGFISQNPDYPIIGNIYENPELIEK